MAKKEFKTSLFGYDKNDVDKEIERLEADINLIAEDTKQKIKQAQAIAVKANNEADELKKEVERLKKELDDIKNK